MFNLSNIRRKRAFNKPQIIKPRSSREAQRDRETFSHTIQEMLKEFTYSLSAFFFLGISHMRRSPVRVWMAPMHLPARSFPT